jgi:hypothetical protein
MISYYKERVYRDLLGKENRRGAAGQVGFVLPTLRGWLFFVESKDLMALCHSFCIFIFMLQYLRSYNHTLLTFAEALLHIFIATGPVGVPSLYSNSGLPYSKLAHYHLSYAAP